MFLTFVVLYFSLVCSLLRGEECGRSCISYGLIQIVRDVISCSFFSIFVSSFSCARDVEISVVPDFDP